MIFGSSIFYLNRIRGTISRDGPTGALEADPGICEDNTESMRAVPITEELGR